MAKKKSSWKKKLAKAALIGGALYGASKLGKGKSVADTAATEGIKWTPGPTIPDIHSGLRSNRYKFDTDHLRTPTLAAKGGRIGAKKGGHVKSMGIAKRGGGVAKR